MSTRDAVAERDEAMRAVDAAADPRWKDKAWDTLVNYLRSHDTFFVDDFWRDSHLARPEESRALGPIVARAAREDLISKTGEYRPSIASHMTAKPVWRSHIKETK